MEHAAQSHSDWQSAVDHLRQELRRQQEDSSRLEANLKKSMVDLLKELRVEVRLELERLRKNVQELRAVQLSSGTAPAPENVHEMLAQLLEKLQQVEAAMSVDRTGAGQVAREAKSEQDSKLEAIARQVSGMECRFLDRFASQAMELKSYTDTLLRTNQESIWAELRALKEERSASKEGCDGDWTDGADMRMAAEAEADLKQLGASRAPAAERRAEHGCHVPPHVRAENSGPWSVALPCLWPGMHAKGPLKREVVECLKPEAAPASCVTPGPTRPWPPAQAAQPVPWPFVGLLRPSTSPVEQGISPQRPCTPAPRAAPLWWPAGAQVPALQQSATPQPLPQWHGSPLARTRTLGPTTPRGSSRRTLLEGPRPSLPGKLAFGSGDGQHQVSAPKALKRRSGPEP